MVASLVLILVCMAVVKARELQVILKRIPSDAFVKKLRGDSNVQHELVFAVQQKNLKQLEDLVLDISNPKSVKYQQWMSSDQVGNLTSNVIGSHSVQQWLEELGARVTWKSRRSDYIRAIASLSVWEGALETQFHQFERTVRIATGKTIQQTLHRADEYSLPGHMKEHLSAVFHTVQTPPQLNANYFEHEKLVKSHHLRQRTSAVSSVTVEFLNTYYKINNNTGSTDQEQAVFQTAGEYFCPNDLRQFQRNHNIPDQPAEVPNGYSTSNCLTNSCSKGNLDMQYLMGIAQQINTSYWYTAQTNTTDPLVDWITEVANTPNPPLVNSISWGTSERDLTPDVLDAFNTEALKLAAMGVTVIVSSGDNGAAGAATQCTNDSSGAGWTGAGYFPSFPASSPYVTVVGATMGPESGTPEVACQSQEGGMITSGGGFSSYFSTPDYQRDAVDQYFSALATAQLPTAGFNRQGRAYPDVSLLGVNFEVIVQYLPRAMYGTGAAAPVYAAMISLINAARAREGKPSLGFLNPTLYAYGARNNTFGVNGTSINPFNDISSGHNKCTAQASGGSVVCCDSGFYSTEGWDPVTGWGSAFYPNMSAMFGNPVQFYPPVGKNHPPINMVSAIAIVLVCVIIGTPIVAFIATTLFHKCGTAVLNAASRAHVVGE